MPKSLRRVDVADILSDSWSPPISYPILGWYQTKDSLWGVIDSGLVGSTDFYGRGAARAEDAQGTPTQSHISPSIVVYEEYRVDVEGVEDGEGRNGVGLENGHTGVPRS